MLFFAGCGLAPKATRPIREPVLCNLVGSCVAAGFPSPADDYMERPLDLNEHLVQRPESTYFVRVTGDSMIEAGIHDGDLLVVDRSRTPVAGDVVIACVDGEFLVKRLARSAEGQVVLLPENSGYAPLAVPPEADFSLWGVAVHVIHSL
ncbi:translesion error-prone DNA polymerase V autoproteolytic subunit [Pseudodesulfovibrio senegalensis]|uniref:Translesion error-prone DNA polymerase V autoproteolytic subunit n=2 Tax=Pseudodesulfovibrio senegalensis TaxID=1721087 RepID=A0A6N6N7Q2_9BACT|nr:translesion error-prone DNA polymerase V autoproteolytic subunit [Pseudodesulfovibrio senegalensis]